MRPDSLPKWFPQCVRIWVVPALWIDWDNSIFDEETIIMIIASHSSYYEK